MSIRRFRAEDLAVLHEANQASVPGVSTETMEDLRKWIALSTCFVATDETDHPLGFPDSDCAWNARLSERQSAVV